MSRSDNLKNSMNSTNEDRLLLSGDEAVAHAAIDSGVALATGYPGTPSTEIVETFVDLGGRGQWAPNEKVALEVGIGVSFAGARALVTMKHVGLNVAADPLFTATYTNTGGALVIVSADDPGMASSQNEQDNRRLAAACGAPMLEPADSQEAYDFLRLAVKLSECWRIPVLLRMTTRVCHSKTVVRRAAAQTAPAAHYERDISGRVMIPANARPAHRRLRSKLAEIAAWNEKEGPNVVVEGSKELGIITSGITYQHVREAAPEAAVLKLGLTHPLPLEKIRAFAAAHERVVVIDEGDPYIVETCGAAGIQLENKAEMYRFGEMTVGRVRRVLARDETPEAKPAPGKPPELCPGCPHRVAFTALRELGCIVSGDIGCYTLGVLKPFEAMDTCVCMGASIGVGLGLRHALPEAEARKVVSVIGDSTFMHSGLTGLVEAVYNPPPTGHVILILDNGTTAMTGMQEHPGTGRSLDHHATAKVVFEDVARAMGVKNVHVLDPLADPALYKQLLSDSLEKNELTVVIARRTCLLAAGAIRQYEKLNQEAC
jgi:indolepyruvate ferredoxin oxidoreductase alpha subunit